MTESQLKKAIIARLKADGPYRTCEQMGVSANLLVMFAHGYSKPQKGTMEKLEAALGKVKTVKRAARHAK